MVEEDEKTSPCVVMGLRCSRCGGTSIMQVDPVEGTDMSAVWACPHCFNGDRDSYRISTGYDIEGFTLTNPDLHEPTDALDSVPTCMGNITGIEWGAYRAVRLEGKTYAERGRERGVDRGGVRQSVLRAEKKLID